MLMGRLILMILTLYVPDLPQLLRTSFSKNVSNREYTENFNTKPLPFECIIEPRGPEFVKIIEKENAEALDALACYKVDDDGLSEENKKAVEGYRRDLVFETT